MTIWKMRLRLHIQQKHSRDWNKIATLIVTLSFQGRVYFRLLPPIFQYYFSKAEIYARDLVKCCRLGYKEYYYFTRGMVEKMDRKYFVSLPLPFRILLKLPNYYIALIYVKLASMFKKQ